MTVFAMAVLGLSLAACNTVEGAGRDIESAGEAVQDSAN
ncbi:MAG TPA: entericidin A/B family lipoprotein [Alphaproteobacteria bacterium]|nr:entericidin A/B family lipoprotein [Alphaproteobacteria bacterium]